MIPFSPPLIDEDVLNEVADTLKSGWITTGPKVRALEDEISKLSGSAHVLCFNSATSGLFLSLKWFGIGPGDDVIVPSYTYCSTALVVYHLGATPVMVDITDDFNIDPEKVRKAITPRTKAIIPVDIAGWPAHYDEINKIVTDPDILKLFNPASAEQKLLGRILVLSDAAHSIGAVYQGKPSGSLADLTVFSLHAVKNITTAEGGAICINMPPPFVTKDIYKTMRLMCLNGQTKDAYTKNKAGGWRYDIVLPGYKMNMPDICAAIGLAQIKKYRTIILPERRRIAELYYSLLGKFNWAILPPLIKGQTESSYHLFALRIKGATEIQRDKIITEIASHEVAVNVHFIPLPLLSVFRNLGYSIKDHPTAFSNYSAEISLPIYPQLTNEQVDYIVNSVELSYITVMNNDQIL
jgi:dTDP-4-amino-4,6-dideoxygalactose transaminase